MARRVSRSKPFWERKESEKSTKPATGPPIAEGTIKAEPAATGSEPTAAGGEAGVTAPGEAAVDGAERASTVQLPCGRMVNTRRFLKAERPDAETIWRLRVRQTRLWSP